MEKYEGYVTSYIRDFLMEYKKAHPGAKSVSREKLNNWARENNIKINGKDLSGTSKRDLRAVYYLDKALDNGGIPYNIISDGSSSGDNTASTQPEAQPAQTTTTETTSDADTTSTGSGEEADEGDKTSKLVDKYAEKDLEEEKRSGWDIAGDAILGSHLEGLAPAISKLSAKGMRVTPYIPGYSAGRFKYDIAPQLRANKEAMNAAMWANNKSTSSVAGRAAFNLAAAAQKSRSDADVYSQYNNAHNAFLGQEAQRFTAYNAGVAQIRNAAQQQENENIANANAIRLQGWQDISAWGQRNSQEAMQREYNERSLAAAELAAKNYIPPADLARMFGKKRAGGRVYAAGGPVLTGGSSSGPKKSELERGELALRPDNKVFAVGGKKHEQGGEKFGYDVLPPNSLIFSDSLKPPGQGRATYADIGKSVLNQGKTGKNGYVDPTTKQRLIDIYNNQETNKEMGTFNYGGQLSRPRAKYNKGGRVPKYWDGGQPRVNPNNPNQIWVDNGSGGGMYVDKNILGKNNNLSTGALNATQKLVHADRTGLGASVNYQQGNNRLNQMSDDLGKMSGPTDPKADLNTPKPTVDWGSRAASGIGGAAALGTTIHGGLSQAEGPASADEAEVSTGSAAGKGALSGMAAGAAAGSIIPGWGCVCADTIVYTKTGAVKKIQELCESDGILGYLDGKIDQQDINGFTEPNIKPCFEIETTKGEKLRCSDDHPILWSNSNYYSDDKKVDESGNTIRIREKLFDWKEAKDIAPGDQIAIIESVPMFGENKLDNARMIGMLIGDGSYTKDHGVRYWSQDEELQEFAVSLGAKLSETREGTKKNLLGYIFKDWTGILRNIGILYQSSVNKTLPVAWWRYNKESLSELVGGLYDTDGCVNVDGDRVNIKISQISENIIDNLKLILIRFGIHASKGIEKEKSNGGIKSKQSYVLTIRDRNSLINFYNNIKLLIKYKQDNLNIIPELYNTKSSRYNKNGIIFETVKSVTPIGDQEIYNLEALGSHTYLANNIITHNTVIGGAIGAIGGGLAGLFGAKGKNKKIAQAKENRKNAEDLQNKANKFNEKMLDYRPMESMVTVKHGGQIPQFDNGGKTRNPFKGIGEAFRRGKSNDDYRLYWDPRRREEQRKESSWWADYGNESSVDYIRSGNKDVRAGAQRNLAYYMSDIIYPDKNIRQSAIKDLSGYTQRKVENNKYHMENPLSRFNSYHEAKEAEQATKQPETKPNVAKKSFSQHFNEARKAGKKEFIYNGKRYHTRTKQEEAAAASKKATTVPREQPIRQAPRLPIQRVTNQRVGDETWKTQTGQYGNPLYTRTRVQSDEFNLKRDVFNRISGRKNRK